MLLDDDSGDGDDLSNLQVEDESDERILHAGRWLPRMEITCGSKTAWFLGGHNCQTNTLMVWCTCGEEHAGDTCILTMESWVIEHCKGQSTEDYDEDEVDAICFREATVARIGGRVLRPQPTMQQLVCQAAQLQGAAKALKDAAVWLYWYDQPFPAPGSDEYRGKGKSWCEGAYVTQGVGIWYKARVSGCTPLTGKVQLVYEVDGSADEIFLPLTFAHFGPRPPPTRESPPDYLPDMRKAELLGRMQAGAMPGATAPSAAGAGTSRAGGGSAAGPAPKRKAPPPAPAGAAAAAPRPAPAAGAGATCSGDDDDRSLGLMGRAGPPLKKAKGSQQANAAAAPAQKAAAAVPGHAPASGGGKAASTAAATAAAALATAPAAVHPTPPAALASAQQQPLRLPQRAPLPTASSATGPRGTHNLQRLLQPRAAPAVPAAAATSAAAAQVPRAAAAAPAPTAGSGRGALQGPAAVRDGAAGAKERFLPTQLVSQAPPAPRRQALSTEAVRQQALSRPGCRGELSGQAEQVPVFAFNSVDAAPLPAGRYMQDYQMHPSLPSDAKLQAALEALQLQCARCRPPWSGRCGVAYARQLSSAEGSAAAGGSAAPQLWYGADGRLQATRPCGLHECDARCCRAPECRANMQLSRGPSQPLEVFRTPDRQWGVRCAAELLPGDFVCAVIGQVRRVADPEVQQEMASAAAAWPPQLRHSAPCEPRGGALVVPLDHFNRLWECVNEQGLRWAEKNVKLARLPPDPASVALRLQRRPGPAPQQAHGDAVLPSTASADLQPFQLAVDMRQGGNVARYVRRCRSSAAAAAAGQAGEAGPASSAAGPNLIAQPVLARDARSPLLYYIGLYAARCIPPMQELTVDLFTIHG